MKKFILIDNSIVDKTGHNLEYAIRVLKEAKKDNFTTILITNKKFKVTNNLISDEIDKVYNVFTNTFWVNNFQSETNWFLKFIKKYIYKFTNFLKVINFKIFISKYFQIYFFLKNNVEIYPKAKLFFLLLKINNYFKNFRHRLTPLELKIYYFFSNFFNYLKNKIFLVFKASIYILNKIFVIFISNLNFKNNLFERQLKKILKYLKLNNNCIIFFPTIGQNELYLCTKIIKKYSELKWIFIFRRELFQDYNDNSNIYEHNKFSLTLNLIKKISNNFKFYTDTNLLTNQYNRLNVVRFETLPIPLPEIKNKKNDNEIIQLSYLGDARDEKNYQLLDKLILDLDAASIDFNKIKFVIQSNFNVDNGEKYTRVAKSNLLSLAKKFENIDIINKSIASDEYNKILNNTDILLLPYNNKNYRARSSGVFAEAQSNGIPSIIMHKTWMSDQIDGYNQKYYQTLLSSKILQIIKLKKKI